jgi:Domain of unknown function (DUF4124)
VPWGRAPRRTGLLIEWRYAVSIMRIFILILLSASFAATAAEVFRWTDDNGVIHFSDLPQEGAEKITVEGAQTFSAPAPQRRERDSGSTADEQDGFSYSAVNIVSPGSGEVLWNTGGSMKVSVNTQPKLKLGHTQMVYLDGQVAANLNGSQRSAELTGIERGEHTLTTEVRNADGDVVGTGNAVTFMVQQTSVQNPNNPNIPTPAPR